MLRASRFGFASAVVCALGLVVACSRCGGDASTPAADAASDVRTDQFTTRDASGDVLSDDSGPLSDWVGWRRLVEFDPNCVVDVPIDPTKALPTIKWVACTNGTPGCQQIDTTGWREDADTNFISDAKVNLTGNRITIARLVTLTEAEFDIYSFPDFAPIAAWRSFGGSGCEVEA